jgi:hypothetical protein
MNLEYVPLLRIQREIQGMPRNMERFEHYLRTIGAKDSATLELPTLLVMNPMGKEHVTRQLDELLAMDADAIAAEAVRAAAAEVVKEPGEFKIGLVIADDLLGGWTNRCDYEYTLRFPPGPSKPAIAKRPRWLKHFWLHAVLWSSEPPSEKGVREALRTSIFRTAYRNEHGYPRTLRDMLAQEGAVMARAGCTGPALEDVGLAATRAIIEPFLDATDKRTAIECLCGDEPASKLGFTPRGLKPWAGLALALHDAMSRMQSTKHQPVSSGQCRLARAET